MLKEVSLTNMVHVNIKPTNIIFALSIDLTVVGGCILHYIPQNGQPDHFRYVSALVVDSGWRRCGIGKHLLEIASAGRQIVLQATRTNVPYYQRMDFAIVTDEEDRDGNYKLLTGHSESVEETEDTVLTTMVWSPPDDTLDWSYLSLGAAIVHDQLPQALSWNI